MLFLTASSKPQPDTVRGRTRARARSHAADWDVPTVPEPNNIRGENPRACPSRTPYAGRTRARARAEHHTRGEPARVPGRTRRRTRARARAEHHTRGEPARVPEPNTIRGENPRACPGRTPYAGRTRAGGFFLEHLLNKTERLACGIPDF